MDKWSYWRIPSIWCSSVSMVPDSRGTSRTGRFTARTATEDILEYGSLLQ